MVIRVLPLVFASVFLARSCRPTIASVHPLFDLSAPSRSPSPSDRFTVADADQNTGRRVNLEMPADCVDNMSDCQDVTVLNRLDGFNMNPQISIPFDGDIDPATVNSENI